MLSKEALAELKEALWFLQKQKNYAIINYKLFEKLRFSKRKRRKIKNGKENY
jgi:hypothetical protein